MSRKQAKTTEQLFLGEGRMQGIACALAELADVHMEPDLAAMVLQSLGLTVADLKKAGADAFDLGRLSVCKAT